MASEMATIAAATVSAMSVKALAAVSMMGAQASTMVAMPSETPGKASPMAVTMSDMAVEKALMTSGREALMPESRLAMMSPPELRRVGRSPAMALTTSPMAEVTVVSSSGALSVMPPIRLEINSPPLASISGRWSAKPPAKVVTAWIAPSISCGAASRMPVSRVPTISAAVVSSSGRWSAMTWAKSVSKETACCIMVGPLVTMLSTRPVSICNPVSSRDGMASISDDASVVMMSVASGMSSGRFSVTASRMEVRIGRAVSISVGSTSVMVVEMPATPSLIFATPPSPSPLKIRVRPSMTDVKPGRNSASMLFFSPVKDCVMFCRLSWKAAEALTSSSLITMPRSWTCFFMASMSSALVFNSGPSSAAPLPNSSVASLLRSVSSATPWRAVTVALNRSSRLMEAASSWEIPSLPKASEPSSAALESLISGVFSASMLLPECWRMKSHS